jgi:hypothetical protein
MSITFDEFIRNPRLVGVRRSGDQYTSCCPSHDDKHQSFTFTYRDGRILGNCKAGCPFEDWSSALGYAPRDLWDGNKSKSLPKKPGAAVAARLPEVPSDKLSQAEIDSILTNANALALKLLAEDDDPISALAEHLHIPVAAMLAVSFLGFVPEHRQSANWVEPAHALFCEKDAEGNWLGANRRYPDYIAKELFDGVNKRNMPKTTRGLTYAADWDKFPGMVWNFEGASDTCIAYAAKICAVGRNGASGGGKYLVPFLHDPVWRNGREIVFSVENDQNAEKGTWPGMAGARVVAEQLCEGLGIDILLCLVPEGYKDIRQFLSAKCDYRDPIALATAGREFVEKSLQNTISYRKIRYTKTESLASALEFASPHPILSQSGKDGQNKDTNIHDQVSDDSIPNSVEPYRISLYEKPSCTCHSSREEHEDDESVGIYHPPAGEPLSAEMRYIHGRLNPFAPTIFVDDNPLYFTKGRCAEVFTFFLKCKQKTDSGTKCFAATGTCDKRTCLWCMARLRSEWFGSVAAHFSTATTAGEVLHYIECSHAEWNAVKQRLKNSKAKHFKVAIDNGNLFVICNKAISGSTAFESYTQAMNAVDVALQSMDLEAKRMMSSSRAWKLPRSEKISDYEFMGKASHRVPTSQIIQALWTAGLDVQPIKRVPKGFTSAYGWTIPPDWEPARIAKLFKCLKSGKSDWGNGKSPTWADFGPYFCPEVRKSA